MERFALCFIFVRTWAIVQKMSVKSFKHNCARLLLEYLNYLIPSQKKTLSLFVFSSFRLLVSFEPDYVRLCLRHCLGVHPSISWKAREKWLSERKPVWSEMSLIFMSGFCSISCLACSMRSDIIQSRKVMS